MVEVNSPKPDHKCKLEWPGWDPQVNTEAECAICKCVYTLLWVPEVEMGEEVRSRTMDIYSTKENP